LKKLFNMHEGWRPQDDWLPERLLSEVLPTGVAQGIGLTPAERREMIQEYYQTRGWDNNGFVPQEKLQELGITSPVSGLEPRVLGQLETGDCEVTGGTSYDNG